MQPLCCQFQMMRSMGPVVSNYFAMVAAWTGEKDLAIEWLSAVLQPGVYASFCTDYGMLKTFPLWDPLRDDPRFQKNVASLAPKNNPVWIVHFGRGTAK